MSAAMDRERATEAPLPYADDLPPDGPQERLSIAWCSPEAELATLVATGEYDISQSRTHEEKMVNLNLYVEARRLFAEGTGMQVWVEGSLNRAVDARFLTFLDDFRARTAKETEQRIAVLKAQANRRKHSGITAVQASLMSE